MAQLIATNQLTLTNVIDGAGIASVTNYYLASTQSEGVTRPSGTGGHNLLINTVSLENNITKSVVNTLDKYNGGTIAKGIAPSGSYIDIYSQRMKTAPQGNIFIGSFYAKSTLEGHRINCHFYSPNRTIKAMSSDGYTWSNATGADGLTYISLSTEWKRYWIVWTIRDASSQAENVPMAIIFGRNFDSVNEVSVALPALYSGNINKDHSIAPEDAGWTTTPQQLSYTKRFLWNYRIELYTDGTTKTTEPAVIGVYGDKGDRGETPYIHWAYSDNADGTGLTSSDKGQRYIGHYSDYTQADSMDKTKYRWTDRWAKIEVGGRNYFKQSTIARSAGTNPVLAFYYRNVETPNGFKVTGNSTSDGVIRLYNVINSDGLWTVSFDMRGSQSVPVSLYVDICDQGVTKVTTNNTNTYQRYSVTVNVTKYSTNPTTYNFVDFANIAWAYFWIDNIMIEKASAPSDFQLAPEDIQANIDTKADQELTQQQLNLLVEKAQLMQTELEAKVAMETLSDLERAYKSYVEANDKAVAKSQADLIEAGRRVDAMVEVLGGLSKTKKFIDTYITEADEGIVIGTNDNVSQIRVTYDRIAMYSAGKEVMYISQGVIHIDNGIFTKSLQVGRFRTEQHQTNLDINVCRYVG